MAAGLPLSAAPTLTPILPLTLIGPVNSSAANRLAVPVPERVTQLVQRTQTAAPIREQDSEGDDGFPGARHGSVLGGRL